MSKLKKLMIQGIRSFNPNDKNILEFYTPLTLIVGANGTGKTTIIECLKYITTGEMPPNSRGGAFIYDPKVAKEIDIKAEIKLKFINNKGDLLICSRSIQSTLKKGKTEQKTLDISLYKEMDDKNILIATKLADIDRDIPKHLVVSHSILENVIFCHQDESTWPLGDPTSMKKKLDDIFSSTKYNKALLGMKGCKKEINSDLKLKEQELSYIFKEKIKRDEVLQNISHYNSEVEKKKHKLKIFDEEIERINGNMKIIQKDLDIFYQLEQNYRILNSEFETCKNFIKNFGFEILPEQSINRKDKIIENIISIKKNLEGLSKNKIEIEFAELELLRKKSVDEHNKNIQILNSVAYINKQNENMIQERKEFISWLLNEFPCEENQIFEKTKESFDSIDKSIKQKADELEELKQELFELKTKQNESKKIYKENLDFINKHKNLEQKEIDINFDFQINYEKQIELDAYVYELMDEYNVKQQKLDEMYKLSKESFRKSQIKEDINKIKDKLANECPDTIYNQITSKHVLLNKNKELLKVLEKRKNMLEITKQKEIENNEKLLNEIKYFLGKLNYKSENLINQTKGLVNISKLTPETLKSNEFNELCEPEIIKDVIELEDELVKCKNIIVASSHASSVYLNFCKLGEKNKECPLCKKSLNENEKIAYVSKLNRVIGKLPESIKNAEKKQKDLETTISYIHKTNSEIERRNQIREEIRRLVQKVNFVIQDFDQNAHNKEINSKIGEIQNLENELADLKFRLSTIENLRKQLEKLEEDYDRLPDSICLEPIKNSLEETKSLLEIKTTELNQVNNDIKDKENTKKLYDIELENRRIIKLRDEKIEQNKTFSSNNFNENTIEELDRSILKRTQKLDSLKNNFIRKKMDVELKLKQIEDLKNSLIKNETKIAKLKEEISNENGFVIFNNKNITIEMVRDEQIYSECRKQVLEHKNCIIQLTKDLDIEKALLNTVEENIKLIKFKKRAIEIEKEVENFDMKRFTILKDKLTAYEEKKNKTMNSESIIKGELKQIMQILKGLNNEIEIQYKDTLKNYFNSTVEIKTLELSLEDLDKCINALDKAIVDFHKTKIDEVNRLLRELWTNTYKGNDVEYIELKSESSEAKAYNYRIVMVKNGTELDMRGRSSAGQKMIASILFRIALADVFSIGFNVLALDEPTTNLDKDNIESLALTLSLIIKERTNVQMIVITHDEDFVQMLNREGVEYFYRIRRDSNGNGHIERHSIY